MRIVKFVLIAVFVGLLATASGLGAMFYHQATHPADPNDQTRVIVDIEPGATLKETSYILEENNLIRSPGAFRLLAYFQNKQKEIQVGEYKFSPSMLPGEILDDITNGKTFLHPITIPEGYRITEIASLFASKDLADKQAFIRQTKNRELIDSLEIPTDTLEGYLFPETYHFGKYTPELTMVRTMIETFKKRAMQPKFLERARNLKLSFHDIVTLASLVEKETGLAEERRLISSVFHNRLQRKMRLQTDPTVIYAIEDFDGNIRKKDLFIDSPYNTYRYHGLPPGPIANPGIQSIRAALYPADTDYLYFVSRQDGSHEFSSNLMDHNRAVQKYQLQNVNNVSP